MNSSTESSRMVTGLFDDRESAERAYQSLSSRGYTSDDTNVIMSDETRTKYYPAGSEGTSALGDKTMEDAGKGAAIGGTVGATLAAIAAIGTALVLPGGFLIAGPLAAAFAGAGAGGLTGGLIGALVGHGVPKEHAEEYESGIKSGGIFMGVTPRSDEDADYFANDWKNNRGRSIHAVGTGAGALGGAATGAAVGSVVPGIGTAVGGVVGGVAGAIGGHEVAKEVNPKDGDLL